MILGDQFAAIDRPRLMDSLRACLGHQPRWGSVVDGADQERIDGIRAVLAGDQAQSETVVRAGGDLPGFLRRLSGTCFGLSRAALSGLSRSGGIRRSSRMASRFRPGWSTSRDWGVANDEYRRVTAHWIRRARARSCSS